MRNKFRALLVVGLLLLRAIPCNAAVAFVQAAHATAAFSNAVTVNLSATAANALIFVIADDGTTVGAPTPSVSDDKGNTYSAVVLQADSVPIRRFWVCYSAGSTAGVTGVTLSYGATNSNYQALAAEFSGVATSSALDGTIQHTTETSFANPSLWSTPSITTSVASDLIVNTVGGGETNTGALNATGSWTKADASNNLYLGYQLSVATGTYSGAGSNTGGQINHFATFAAAFAPAGGGGCRPTLTLLGVGRCG